MIDDNKLQTSTLDKMIEEHNRICALATDRAFLLAVAEANGWPDKDKYEKDYLAYWNQARGMWKAIKIYWDSIPQE